MKAHSDQAFQAGVQALRDGRPKDAETLFAEVVEADSDHAAAHYNLGVLYYQANRPDAAEAVLTRAVALRPTHVDTHSVLAAVSMALKKIERAVVHADAIIDSPDANPPALHSAGQVMVYAGQTDRAEHAFRRALDLEPTYLLPATALARQLLARRAFDDAKAVCDAALQHRPTDQDLHLQRAQALWEGGHTAAARDALLNLLDFAPDHITAHYNLSLFADQPDPQVAIDRLRSLLAEGDLPQAETIKAWFALGNLHAAQQESEAAFASFAEGNRLRAAAARVTHEQSIQAFTDRANTVVAAPLPDIRSPESHEGPTPLIIAGPSRSGKSLLQAWLSAHPDIAAADEVGVLPKLAEQTFSDDPARKAEAAKTYRDALAKLGGGARFVIDTHPTNVLYLDLLLNLCPDAKIIQMQRDPLDLAVCIFFRNFVSGGHWADTWEGIAARLTCYDKLRTHWESWAPVIATVAYEDLVAKPLETLSQIYKRLDLSELSSHAASAESADLKPMPWASFADRPRPRLDSIGLWKPFATWLGAFAGAYGRSNLPAGHEVPLQSATPRAPFVSALNALTENIPVTSDDIHALSQTPAVHAKQAIQHEGAGEWGKAVAARWQAVSCRPFTSRMTQHVTALHETVSRSPNHQDIAKLHSDIARIQNEHSSDGRLRFGDFGLSYQSCAPAFIAGSRDTQQRVDAYDLQTLSAGAHVLDLGCNAGFLALAASEFAASVQGVEKELVLVETGRRVVQYLEVSNCNLQSGDVAEFQTDRTFDLVIAAAVHGWIDLPIEELGRRFAALTSDCGAVLFESQGQRSTTRVEGGFEDKVKALCNAGFQVERDGQVCDDRVNLRAFVVLRKV